MECVNVKEKVIEMGKLYMSKEDLNKIEKSKELQKKAKQWNDSEIDTLTFLIEVDKYKGKIGVKK